ncbi:DoxX family protein [Sandaracinus amylolyticus]|uniref:DoxX family protein n=1 Tax=Sandaracinus amylolyticus TaxID=927083 RepID=A0A0F6SHB1_9BACT|nr:DoxX family protein [Sandaracinus amylolyticus]AKF10134.1 Hypothetical protein DB32_007283 [Sandaracinus amylolyticus]
MERLLKTDTNDTTLFAQRVLLGAVMLPHGAQKLLGWFGGGGFSPTMVHLTDMGIPTPIAALVILIESFGALFLVLGLLSRASALGIAAVMIGAALTAHLSHGFFMNWFGSQGGEGFEYHLLALGLALPIVIAGGGRHALDTWLLRRLGARREDAVHAVA